MINRSGREAKEDERFSMCITFLLNAIFHIIYKSGNSFISKWKIHSVPVPVCHVRGRCTPHERNGQQQYFSLVA